MAKVKKGPQHLQPHFTVSPIVDPSAHQEEGTQMERGLGFYPALKLLQDVNQARGQLEWELVQETQELGQRYDDKWIKKDRRYTRWQAWMIKQTDATFQEVFSKVSTADSIKLLPWCTSSTVPLCYMSGALATTMQQDEDIPATSAASEPEGSPAPGPSSSPTHPPQTPSLPVPPLPDIPFVGTPLVGFPFAEFLAVFTQKKWDYSSSGSLNDHHDKTTHVDSQEVEARSEHSSAQGNEDMPKFIPEAVPKGRNLSAPFQSSQGHHLSWWWYCSRKLMEYQRSGFIWVRLIKGGWGWLWCGHSLWRLCNMFRHRWSDHTNCVEEIPEEGTSFL